MIKCKIQCDKNNINIIKPLIDKYREKILEEYTCCDDYMVSYTFSKDVLSEEALKILEGE